jgi:outer membrane immunogenic protein
MHKLLFAGIALIAVASGPALAADLPVRQAPAYVPPPIVTYFSWTGCYIGGHVGGVWVQKDWSVGAGDPLFAGGQNFGSHDANGWLGGAQLGCNYQVGGWVFGIQGDYAWTDASGSGPDALNGILLPGSTIGSKVKGLSSVTGRVGYAWDRFLGYVKGGGAWEQDEYSWTAPGFTIGSVSQTRSGWTVGVGGEYAFTNNFTGFIEYDYYGFGTKSATFSSQFGLWDVADIKENKSVVKIGLNWKFGAAPAAVPVYGK